MSRTSLDETSNELIKSHILNPDSSPLPLPQQILLERIISAGKILDKNPIAKNAANLLRTKYPEISYKTATRDISMAMRLFNTIHSFDYDFWHTWLINDIVSNIARCNNDGSPAARKTIAIEHNREHNRWN